MSVSSTRHVAYLTDHIKGIHDENLLSIWEDLGVKVTYLNTAEEKGSSVERQLMDSSISAVQVGPISSKMLGYVRCVSKPLILTSWGNDLLAEDSGGVSSKILNLVSGNPLTHMIVDTYAGKQIGISCGLNSERITQVPWGVGKEYFQIFERRSLSERARVGGQYSIFINRRHENIYQVKDVIRACEFLGSTDYRIRLGGEGSETSTLISTVSDLGLENRVDFLGWLSKTQTIDELSLASIYVNPSSVDGSSISMLEAMASGVLVVASDSQGNKEWVTPESGFMYQSGNVEELSMLLARLTNQTDWTNSIRRVQAANNQAFHRARWEINSRKIAQDLMLFLNECLV